MRQKRMEGIWKDERAEIGNCEKHTRVTKKEVFLHTICEQEH